MPESCPVCKVEWAESETSDCEVTCPKCSAAGAKEEPDEFLKELQDVADILGFVKGGMVSPYQASVDIRALLGFGKLVDERNALRKSRDFYAEKLADSYSDLKAENLHLRESLKAVADDTVTRELERLHRIEAAWRGCWTRGGPSLLSLKRQGYGATAWLLERLTTIFEEDRQRREAETEWEDI